MRIQIEKLLPLVPRKVMTTTRPPPRNTNRLRHGQGRFKGRVVDGGDAVDSQADAEDDEGGFEDVVGVFLRGGGQEGFGVDVAVVRAGVDAEVGEVVFVCEGSVGT